MNKTILIVDDDRKMREMLRLYLAEDGYHIIEAGNGREALYVARYEKPDLILLDLMMPEMDGIEFTRIYRREANTPIIMLTAKVDDTDEAVGLEMGADDYITKPFVVRTVRARVKAALRRAGSDSFESDIVRAGEITLDRIGRILKIAGQTVDLTPSEFNLLDFLMTNPGRAFSRIDLLAHIAEDALETQVRTIDVHIRHLRAKMSRTTAIRATSKRSTAWAIALQEPTLNALAFWLLGVLLIAVITSYQVRARFDQFIVEQGADDLESQPLHCLDSHAAI